MRRPKNASENFGEVEMNVQISQSRPRRIARRPAPLGWLGIALLALAFGGCDADSPTAPSQTPAPPATVTPNGGWKVTVVANPDVIDLAAETGVSSSAITVTATRNSDGAPAPRDSTALLSTTAGTLINGSGTTGTSIPVTFQGGGRATATLDLAGVALGTVTVTAQLEGSSGQDFIQVAEGTVDPLFIQSVTPNNGPPTGGTQVTIRGTGFDEPIRVTFGTSLADVVSVNSNRIVVTTPPIDLPAGQTQAVAVTVNINVNDPVDTPASDSVAGAFTYARANQTDLPTIVSLTPTSGPNEGGTEVTIFGENFADEVQVFFGTSALIEAPVLNTSPTRLVVRTPSATGPNAVNQNSIVNVRVTNTASGSSADLGGAFQYGGPNQPVMFISAAGPNEGIYLGGTIVTIFGQGFEEPVAVEFGGMGQQEISVTGTEIVARSNPVEIVNCNRPTGNFRVVNIETAEIAESTIPFTYRPVEPVIFDITPRDDTGSSTFTISGAGFDQPRVIFGANVVASGVSVTSLDPDFDSRFGIGNEITGIIPEYDASRFGDFPVSSCLAQPDDVPGEQLNPISVNVTVTNIITGCSDTVSSIFQYVPENTTCVPTTTGDGGGGNP